MVRLSCLGGWCLRRTDCARHLANDRSRPVERLCEPGLYDAFQQIKPDPAPIRFAVRAGAAVAPRAAGLLDMASSAS